MHEKIKALLPKNMRKEECTCFISAPCTFCENENDYDVGQRDGYNQCLAEVHAKIPEIVALVEEEECPMKGRMAQCSSKEICHHNSRVASDMSEKQEKTDKSVHETDSEYWTVEMDGDVYSNIWMNDSIDRSRLAFGNCFRTQAEALAARDKIKEILK